MEAFCASEGIPYEICGKVIVAVSEDELAPLQRIFERGQANGVRCEIIGPERLRELEPHTAGIRAIDVPEAGIVNFRAVCRRLAERVIERGGRVVTRACVSAVRSRGGEVLVHSTAGDFAAKYMVNCAGLQSDRVARLSGQRMGAKIIPFRGEFYELLPAAHYLCRNLIYPVPDPNFPFLGVHFTRTIDGRFECGPNAVLALAREGYRKTQVNLRDLAESLAFPGFLRLTARYWRVGATELWRSLSKKAFVRALQRLVPEIRPDHLRAAPSGIRAQAVGSDGNLVDDFLISETPRIIHVGNAPSPAATASLHIGKFLVDKLAERF
jgi:L-2-hydroxyglutarate oxidase